MNKTTFTTLLFLFFFISVNGQCDDVLLKTQTAIDTFRCTLVTGNLIISDNNDGIDDIVSLEPLRNSGLVEIEKTLIIKNCHRLKSFDGIDQITSIGERFRIFSNDSLLAIQEDEAFPFQISRIGFDLSIHHNLNLKLINGFEEIDTLPNRLEFFELPSLERISNFNNIDTIRRIIIKNNLVFNSQPNFPSLREISDSLIIARNPLLTNCCWIEELFSITPESNIIFVDNGPGCDNFGSTDTIATALSSCPVSEKIFNLPGSCFGSIMIENPELSTTCNLNSYTLTVTSEMGMVSHQFEVGSEELTTIDDLQVGMNEIEFLAINDDGSESSCNLTIAVEDIEFPQFQQELQDDTLQLIGESCFARYSIVFPIIIDNCAIANTEFYIISRLTLDTVFRTDAVQGANYNIDLSPGEYRAVAFASDANSLTDISSANLVVPLSSSVALQNCPVDITIDINQEEDCLAILDYDSPKALDGQCIENDLLKEITRENGSIISSKVVSFEESIIDTFTNGISFLTFRLAGVADEEAMCTAKVSVIGEKVLDIALEAAVLDCSNQGALISVILDTSQLTYSWSGPQNFSSVELEPLVFNPGTYTLSVQDIDGCLSEESIDVIINTTPIDVNLLTGEVDCELGVRPLKADLELVDYLFLWTGPNGFTSDLAQPLISDAGWYYLRAEGNFGCLAIDSILIQNDIDFQAEVLVNQDEAEVIISGGTPPFSFEWDNGDTMKMASNFENGEHLVTVTDGLGCSEIIPFSIMISSVAVINSSSSRVLPNPVDQYATIKGADNLYYKIVDSQGRIIMQDQLGKDGVINLVDLLSGMYFLSLSNGDMHKIIKI